MKKALLISIAFIFISCSHMANNKQFQNISMAIVGYTIETVLERYGAPDYRYISRELGTEFLIYDNKSIRINDGIFVDVQEIH